MKIEHDEGNEEPCPEDNPTAPTPDGGREPGSLTLALNSRKPSIQDGFISNLADKERAALDIKSGSVNIIDEDASYSNTLQRKVDLLDRSAGLENSVS